jgi:hypothetical protein
MIAAFFLSIFAMSFVNQYEEYEEAHTPMIPGQETVLLDFQSLTKSNGCYNICLTVTYV